MMKEVKQKLTLAQPAPYQIKVPGELDESWSDWAGGMTITVESEGEGPPVTTLTGTVDQAAPGAPPRSVGPFTGDWIDPLSLVADARRDCA